MKTPIVTLLYTPLLVSLASAQEHMEVTLRSGTHKTFDRLFVLEPDDLHRIEGVYRQHAPEISPNWVVRYNVQRNDDRFYHTTRLDDVLSDPNVEPGTIRMLGIELLDLSRKPELRASDYTAAVAFSESGGAKLLIHNNDRQWALLLADAMEPQIKRTFRLSAAPRWFAHVVVLSFMCVLARLVYHVRKRNRHLEDLCDVGFVFFVIAAVFTLGDMFRLCTFHAITPLVKAVSTKSVFLWGHMAEEFPVHQARTDRVFWGLIVALAVAVAANITTHFGLKRFERHTAPEGPDEEQKHGTTEAESTGAEEGFANGSNESDK